MKWFLIVVVFFIVFVHSSCVVSKQSFGNYESMNGKIETYKKTKDFYLFWEMVTVKTTSEDIDRENYQLIKKRNLFDNVVFYGSFGIFSFYTVKVKIKDSYSEKKGR